MTPQIRIKILSPKGYVGICLEQGDTVRIGSNTAVVDYNARPYIGRDAFGAPPRGRLEMYHSSDVKLNNELLVEKGIVGVLAAESGKFIGDVLYVASENATENLRELFASYPISGTPAGRWHRVS